MYALLCLGFNHCCTLRFFCFINKTNYNTIDFWTLYYYLINNNQMFWLIFIPKIVFSYMMCIIKVKRKGSRAMWAFKDAIIRCGMYIHDMTKICSTMGKPNIKIFVSVGQTTFLVKAVIIPIWSFSINHMLFWRDWKTRTTLANVINGNYWIIDQWKYLSYYMQKWSNL